MPPQIMPPQIMEAASAAKTQFLHAQALEERAPSFHPENSVELGPRLQDPIVGDGLPSQLLRPVEKGLAMRLSLSGPELRTKQRRGPQMKKDRATLRERVVMKSYLPDDLKIECLERLDNLARERGLSFCASPPPAAEQHEEEAGALSEMPRNLVLSGGFRAGQAVVARKDLYVEGDEMMAKYMDKATVLGPSRSSDTNRVCVLFEERRDGGTMHVNVLPEEIMSAENGKLMNLVLSKGPDAGSMPAMPWRKPRIQKPQVDQVQLSEIESVDVPDYPESYANWEVPSPWTCHLALGTTQRQSLRGTGGRKPGGTEAEVLRDSGAKMLRNCNSLPSLLRA